MSLDFWAKFFQAAGLESTVAASYANIFFVNKIQPTHLPDIDRHTLKEMNITPMGDILTILKYIKIYCAVVASPTAMTENEQKLLYQDDTLKSSLQFRNIQQSTSGYGDQNQFGCGAQHAIAIAENSILSKLLPTDRRMQQLPSTTAAHYLQSEKISASCDLPPTTVVHDSPMNLTVHGNSRTKGKNGNEHCSSHCLERPDCEPSHDLLCNSKNAVAARDTSEVRIHMYNISPDEPELGSNSDVETCEWQQPLPLSPPVVPNNLLQYNKPMMMINYVCNTNETLPHRPLVEQDYRQNVAQECTTPKGKNIIPGKGTPHQKQPVFDRLSQRPDIEEMWAKTDSQKFRRNQPWRNDPRLKNTPQLENGLMRGKHLRKKGRYRPADDNQVNNNLEPSKTYNGDTNKELISASHLNTDKTDPTYNTVNGQKQLCDVSNGNFNDGGTSCTDTSYICQENTLQEIHSDQRSPHSVPPKVLPSELQDGKTSISASGIAKLTCQEVLIEGPDPIFVSHTSPRISSTSHIEDPELDRLRDPTLTQHTEQFYLAWTDRRKHAHVFPGLKPSFLRVF